MPTLATIAPLLFVGLMGCSAPELPTSAVSASPEAEVQAQKAAPSKVPTEFVTISDPVEKCFSVSVPKGWYNRGYSARVYDVHREVVTCVSPNSDTVLFTGDPSVPQYWSPDTGNPVIEQVCALSPIMELARYQPANEYFPMYAKKKFGKLKNFKITGVQPNEKILGEFKRVFAEHGAQLPDAITVDLKFTYEDKGKKMNGLLIGTTINSGPFWIVEVWGMSTSADVETFRPTLVKIALSKETYPEWTALQNQKHEERMAQMRADHEMAMQRMNQQHAQNMQWIQASAQRHQQRMESIWAAGDASMKSYYERSASSDLQHQSFLNYINDENTVVGSEGRVRQVDNSYQRYFINKHNNSYLGGDIRFDEDAIRRLGLNPDDYEEAKIRP
jgi:hypothetical protein